MTLSKMIPISKTIFVVKDNMNCDYDGHMGTSASQPLKKEWICKTIKLKRHNLTLTLTQATLRFLSEYYINSAYVVQDGVNCNCNSHDKPGNSFRRQGSL